MLWCKLLPWVTLWGCPRPAPAPGSVIPIDKVITITEIVELLTPPPVTVTVTVGIVATPIDHAVPVSTAYPTAAPAARPRMRAVSDAEWDSRYEPDVLNTPLSLHDTIFAFADWFGNAGFDVDFRFTPFLFSMVFFGLMSLHLLFMIVFRDYMMPLKFLQRLIFGFVWGSKLAWTLLFGAGLYLVYDVLPEDPIAITVNELLDLDTGHAYFFVSVTILSWFRDVTFDKQASDHRERLHQLYGATSNLMRDEKWAPKTFTELFVGMVVGLFRCARTVFDVIVIFGIKNDSVLWTIIGPSVHRCMRGLVAFGEYTVFRIKDFLLNKGYTWRSPFHWISKTRPLELWHQLQLLRDFVFLTVWMVALRIPFKPDPEKATSWNQRDAYIRLSHMSLKEMAGLILDHDELKVRFDRIEDNVRRELREQLQVDETTQTLAKRAISFRHSLFAMCRDYNAVRNTLDIFASRVLNALADEQARNVKWNRTFRSARITVANEAFENGLHYKTVRNHGSFELPLKEEVKGICQKDMARIFSKLRWSCGSPSSRPSPNKLKHGYTYIPTMDLFKRETWAFDLGLIGFHPHGISSSESPHLDGEPGTKLRDWRELEDYVMKDQVLQWYEELPAREERKRQLAHPFYGSTGGML